MNSTNNLLLMIDGQTMTTSAAITIAETRPIFKLWQGRSLHDLFVQASRRGMVNITVAHHAPLL
jgi:hypothetical protein